MLKSKKYSLSSSAIIEKLDALKSEYTEERLDHRDFINRMVSDALGVTICLKKSSTKRQKLEDYLGTSDRKKLPSRVMRFIMGASTKNQKRLADKRARAMSYLHDELGVSPKDVPEAIRENGGIEKLARMAAKRKRSEPSDPAKRSKEHTPGIANSTTRGSSKKATNDNERQFSLKLPPKLAAKLAGFDEGAEVKMYGVKRKHEFEVTEIHAVKLKRAG